MELAAHIQVPRDDVFVPTNPTCTVRAVIPKSATPMRSAAKVPLLVAFEVDERDQGADGSPLPPVRKPLACIFKVGDDIRQDVLALQVGSEKKMNMEKHTQYCLQARDLL